MLASLVVTSSVSQSVIIVFKYLDEVTTGNASASSSFASLFLLFHTCIKCSPEYPRLGPGPDAAHQGWRVRLVTHNYLEDKEDSNIIGLIRGEEEPDRFGLI